MLVSYGGDLVSLFRIAATQIDQILKGASPGDITIQQPTKLELVVNARAAKALGLAIPQSILSRADEVEAMSIRASLSASGICGTLRQSWRPPKCSANS
jgi:ABC-type uncharacterized transport system substrate-binding protein